MLSCSLALGHIVINVPVPGQFVYSIYIQIQEEGSVLHVPCKETIHGPTGNYVTMTCYMRAVSIFCSDFVVWWRRFLSQLEGLNVAVCEQRRPSSAQWFAVASSHEPQMMNPNNTVSLYVSLPQTHYNFILS